MNECRRTESGFSLPELLVAMVITVVISASIYGFLARGQRGFGREPEVTDRQQNIRVAMDMIMRDVANAGAGMPQFMQVFTQGLDACTSCPRGGAPVGAGGAPTDDLELITNDSGRDNEPVCHAPGNANSADIRLVRGTTSLQPGMPVLIIMDDGTWTMRNIVSTSVNSTGAGDCAAGNPHVQLNFNSGSNDTTGMNTPGGVCKPNAYGVGNAGSGSCNVAMVSLANLVRYEVRADAQGVPSLYRYSSANHLAGFQVVARGIDDMQATYTNAVGAVFDGAPAVVNNNYGTIITQANVVLSARTEASRFVGDSAAPTDHIRGQLASQGSPRAALYTLAAQPSPGPSPLWK